jgi:hypothetical protein
LNNNISAKRNSAIFLATVLVAGIISLSSPSFMTNVSAQSESYYGMDNNNYKSQYGQDKYKSKDSNSVFVKKINCNNVNVNVNGLELNGLPPSLGGLLNGGEAEDEGQYGANSYGSNGYGGQLSGYDNKNSFKFVCINNNNNTVIGGGESLPPTPPTPPEPPEPTTANLAVTKTTNCELGTPFCTPPPNPQITVTGVNPNPSSFLASQTPVDVTLGAGSYSVSEAGFISGLPQCLPFQGGQLIIGQTIYMCTNFSADCEGDISAGQQLSCTIENTLIVVD